MAENDQYSRRDRQRPRRLVELLGRIILDAGTQALLIHRLSHFLYRRRVPLIPSLVRRINLLMTGADIHPGASFGRNVVLIHSVGIVIGEGAVVGDCCEIYGGVVLGGRGGKRENDGYPHIQPNTVICSGAIVLGPITIGSNVTISAGAVVLDSVPDSCLVSGPVAEIRKIYRS